MLVEVLGCGFFWGVRWWCFCLKRKCGSTSVTPCGIQGGLSKRVSENSHPILSLSVLSRFPWLLFLN